VVSKPHLPANKGGALEPDLRFRNHFWLPKPHFSPSGGVFENLLPPKKVPRASANFKNLPLYQQKMNIFMTVS
jgi:hypothetical protein